MTVATSQLSESLQALIDARLDTIDRMLLGRVPRQDRLAIVKEVESQVFELLQERGGDELERDDVLAVLARLDPPEAYLPDEAGGTVSARVPSSSRPAPRNDDRVAKASGILGLSALGMVLLGLLIGMLALSQSSLVAYYIGLGVILVTFLLSIVGTVLGVVARRGGPWSAVGLVTGILSLVFSLALGVAGVFLG